MSWPLYLSGVPLLSDNDLRFAARVPHLGLPSEMFVGTRLGISVFEMS